MMVAAADHSVITAERYKVLELPLRPTQTPTQFAELHDTDFVMRLRAWPGSGELFHGPLRHGVSTRNGYTYSAANCCLSKELIASP